MKMRRRIWCVALTLSLFATVAMAQDKKREAQLRTVRGLVTDKSDSPVSGSVVFRHRLLLEPSGGRIAASRVQPGHQQ